MHLSFSFRVGHTTVGSIINETCQALWKLLVPEVMQPPTMNQWLQIATDYNELWNCPMCLGSIDGKHVRIIAPPNSGSEFYNYKGYFSLVLLGVSDADYCFVLVDIGSNYFFISVKTVIFFVI